MAGPLTGITVLDLSAVISGPMCCQILADQGAEVIKVEPRVIGDVTRIGGYRNGTISAMFATANRAKRSVALDLTHPAGVEAFLELAASADVIVQNFRPGAVERMGIGPDDVHRVNSRVVYVSISGFGPTGPYADWRVYDPIIQAVVGLPSTQKSQEFPVPDLVRTLACDKATAFTAAQAITAALFARERGQAQGQHLTIPMLDSALYFLWPDTFMAHTISGPGVIPGPTIYQVYRLQPTADGYLVYMAISDAEWVALANALGHPEWMQDERFTSPQARQVPEHFVALGTMVNEAFLGFTTQDVMRRLHDHQVPAAHVNELDDVFSDPQVVHNDSIHTWELADVGTVRQAKPAVRWSHTSHETQWSVDQLGESTEAVLRERGFDGDRLEALRDAGVIA